MNKLYKYLPFGIKVQYKNQFGSGIGKFYGIDISETINIDNVRQADLEDIKPILRPFEDLIKELPLTKAAAEMIGMKEGDIVIPAIIVTSLIILSEVRDKKSYSIENMFLDNGISVKYKHKNQSIDIYKDCSISCNESSYRNFINFTDKPFDFLCAMHFAINFKEDEYIKLEE